MKKLLKIVGLFVLPMYLASCGGSGGSGNVAPTANPILDTGIATAPVTNPTTNPAALFGLAGFTQCGSGGGTVDLRVKNHLAYGNNNAFVYLFNQLGVAKLNSDTFCSDPIFGTSKLVYCKPVVDGTDASIFSTAIGILKQHLQGSITLSAAQINKDAGVDLTPLIHFWGVQPVEAAKLKAKIVAAGLAPSNLIYDRRMKYKSVVPMDNASFRVHAGVFLNKASASITVAQSPDYGEGWYYVRLPKYTAAEGQAAQATLDAIIARYFPAGRPS